MILNPHIINVMRCTGVIHQNKHLWGLVMPFTTEDQQRAVVCWKTLKQSHTVP